MIIGTAGFDLMPSLEVEKLSESTVFRGIEVLLHQSERDARTSRQLPREQHRGIDEFSVGYHPIDYSEGKGLRGIQRVGCVVEFTRLAGTDKFGEKITAAKVAGKPDIRESGHKARRLRGDAQIAGER